MMSCYEICQQIRFVGYCIFCNYIHRSEYIYYIRRLFRSSEGGNLPCNAEDNLRARLLVIEATFRGYCGSPGLGGLWTAGLYPLAGLLDYEDTGLKTSSRVRMGLYLAWKAS